MQIDLILLNWKTKAIQLIQSITYDDWYKLWVASGVVLCLVLAWLSHRIIRKALGHTQFRGTWYNEKQLAELIQIIDEDCKRGYRVMRHDEMALLRRWRFGENKIYGMRQSGYV